MQRCVVFRTQSCKFGDCMLTWWWDRKSYTGGVFVVDLWFDHSVDHIREWTMWKQYSQEVTKAWFSERKGVKMRENDGKNCLFGIRDHEARSSNLRTSTKKALKTLSFQGFFFIFLLKY